MTPQEREEWKEKLKAKVTELIAFSPERYAEPIVNLLIRKDRGSYFVEKYEISLEPDLWMNFLMLTPKGVSESSKTPGVLRTPETAADGNELR